MKKFIVTLLLNLGGFEKYSLTFVCAKNENKAVELALELECHGDFAFSKNKNSITDLANDFEYFVHSCKEIPENEVEILEKYLSLNYKG